MEHETFWSLLHSGPHWCFELFLMALFDGVIGALIWPRFKKWVSHHKSDDDQLADLQKRIRALEDTLNIRDNAR